MILTLILYLIALATAIPAGMLLAWLCNDELKQDRRYFFISAYFLLFASVILMLLYFSSSMVLSLAYMTLILIVMIFKGRSRNAIKKSR